MNVLICFVRIQIHYVYRACYEHCYFVTISEFIVDERKILVTPCDKFFE